MVSKREIIFFAIVIAFGSAISLLAFSIAPTDPLTLTIRLLALNGYIAISIAVIMTPFLKQITLFFKTPFTKVHHYFAVAGLLLITMHPIAVFIQFFSPAVFVPYFTSLFAFFFYGGVIALTLIYVAFGAVLLRRKIAVYWRWLHALMYAALFIGVVHANLRGIDFQSIYIKIVYDGLFAAALLAFGLKRWQFYRLKSRIHKNSLTINNSA
jgi:predicted ferric reductase